VTLTLPEDASPDLAALAGTTGVLRVLLVDYAGFEPLQQLLFAGAADGVPIDPELAAQIARLPAADGVASDTGFDLESLDDAEEEAVFVDQREIEQGEQKHFERAMGQLERFVEDKILVCRRERVSIAEKLKSARTRRDEVVGSSARERIEAEIQRLAARDENLELRIRALESREDEVYRKWREKYRKQRYQAPSVTRLFQSPFRIEHPTPETLC